MKGSLVRGPVREGSALLAGLLRCGHCGRKLHVSYSGRQSAARYHCRGAMGNHGVKDCGVSFGSLRVELAIADEVLRVLQPLGVSAALDAIGRREEAASQKRRQRELALEQARYEAALARRQYDAVDPDNRLVASELERRWNEALKIVARREEELASAGAEVLWSYRSRRIATGCLRSGMTYRPRGVTRQLRPRSKSASCGPF